MTKLCESQDWKSPSKDDHGDYLKQEPEEKSDSEDSSDSDSSSSSSSSSSSNAHSSQDEDDDITGMNKPCLSSSTSKPDDSCLISQQSSVLIQHVHKIPLSGIFDPVLTELVDQYSLKVLEYLENIEKRLFIAELHKEVRKVQGALSWKLL